MVLALVAVLSLTACASGGGNISGGSGAGSAASEPVIIKFAHAGSNLEDKQRPCHFEKIVAERSNGCYDVQVYPNKRPGVTATTLEGIQTGNIEMDGIESGLTVSFQEAETFGDLPYLFTSPNRVRGVIDSEAGNEAAKKREEIGISIPGCNDSDSLFYQQQAAHR